MKNNTVLDLLNHSSSMLQIATNELNRPNEDAVTLCACQCTRNSVSGFLRSFLLEKKSSDFSHHSIENLLSECAGIDSDFNTIDISCFACKALDKNCADGYCLAHEKVSECYDSAKKVEEFVLAKLNVNPKDLA